MLYALLAAPLIAALVTAFASGKDGESSFRLSLLLAVMVAILGVPLVSCMSDLDSTLPWFTLWGTSATVHLHLASDGLSGWLIQLVTWLTPVAILGSRKLVGERIRDFAVCLLVMEALMIGALLARDLVVFYLFFEAMLIPMVVVIALYGGAERRQAALWFFLYTMFGSVFMLVSIWFLAWKLGTSELAAISSSLPQLGALLDVQVGRLLLPLWWILYPVRELFHALLWIPHLCGVRALDWLGAPAAAIDHCRHVFTVGDLLFSSFVLAFAVKVPLVPFHSWQARVYAETPAGGMVMLAGAMAKIGVYGFLRFVLPIFPAACAHYAHYLIDAGLIAVVGGALIALMQDDAKRMLAFSSLSHLGLVMVGVFTFQAAALSGVAVQMVAHGLSVAALFLLVGFLEGRTASRSRDDFGGLADRMPVFSLLLVVSALASAGLPGMANFVGEFLLLFGTYAAKGLTVAAVAGLSVILGVVYLLILVQRWLYGKRHPSLDAINDLGAGEVMAVLPLLLASLFFGFYPHPISSRTDPVLEALSTPARTLSSKPAVALSEPAGPAGAPGAPAPPRPAAAAAAAAATATAP
jgi:NADH-quinone oxidoreductase subunit M